MAAKKMNAFYAQSGGVTAVINASACGVIETARKHKDKIGKVYAGRNGIIGALTEDLIDTGKESAAAIAALRGWLDADADAVPPLVVETSGSTGRPKRVLLSRAAVLASILPGRRAANATPTEALAAE